MTMSEPNLGGNAFFLVCHALLGMSQLYYSIRYKTWGFLFGMLCGHILEIIGYVARIRMHFGEKGFLMYIVTITIGPAFFSAAIYLCLARIIAVYGQHLSRFTPRTYTITFMLSDFIALALQAAGGAILGGEDQSTSTRDTGMAIMKTGLISHLAFITLFIALAGEFGFRAYRRRDNWNPDFGQLRSAWRFKTFLACLSTATLLILIRTAYRVAELSEGYQSKIANDEVAFMLLEGTMIVIATACLAIGHPGACFGGQWEEADFRLRGSKDSFELDKAQSDSVPSSAVV
ncbi:hypothetical protein FSARC_11190 [Fusarium sarcochroum]|uniref:Sphingoid long-chain base transporter RSB1 n=1 Tax=Fusarium sarcochroum TaxID=1208366 RepID=A0A8H4X1T8_9HYPO|nr:hypothetical protein FSARC_11190 [Fusarium sarcochroum]